MCDKAAFAAIEKRLDDHETRLVRVEEKVDVNSSMIKDGFADVKAQLHDMYAVRVEWNKWAMQALTAVGKWVGKWGGIIILAAIGLGNTPKIIEAIRQAGLTAGQ